MTIPRVLTEPIGGSKLSQAMQRGEVPGIGAPAPTDTDGWTNAVRAVRARFEHRRWLEELEPAFGETAGLDTLRRAASDGVVVTTGQQAGLFGGPMLTLVKALGARALADAIERATGVPCATVFWAATDDADFAEAATVKIPATGGTRTLTLTGAPPAGTPMSKAAISGINPLLDALASVAGSGGNDSIAALRRIYRDGVTVGDAYLAYMREVLSPLGIAVIDASHPAVLAAARDVNRKALQDAGAIEERLKTWDADLAQRGFHPQVETVPGLSLVFANADGIKRRIPVAEAAAQAGTNTPLSPTVLLRPIVEAAILPTVSYVGGPGEISYFAQVAPIADVIGVPRPNVVPRWSTTIVEESIQRILDRYGVGIADLRDFDGLLTRIVRDRMPESVANPLESIRSTLADQTEALAKAAGRERIDPKIIEGIKAQLDLRIGRGERRIIAALKRNEEELRRDLGTARGSLYPDGVRQERVLSFVPFLARYDAPLVERMLVEAAAHASRLVGAEAATPAMATR
jgi:bacillithiol biosynthesis cysteine-adding enzyme BshC